ncbi:hypothetical protein SLS62_007246 [Diatrype stigma]|uniref:FAD/NAD(P)-binding domain-containing protein n=1 Tax=Diatrype stigma TaxID=117547 RepID=A0AAN9UPD6_9PEZI
MSHLVDVLIIGSGPAGLACAATLASQLHTAIVFSHGKFRNDPASYMHTVAGWDWREKNKLRQTLKNDIISRHSNIIQFQDVEVEIIVKLNNRQFEVVDTAGVKYLGRRVLLATGIRDLMPNLPGYKELWGRAIFPSLFYGGYGPQSGTAGILATDLVGNTTFVPVVARMAGRLVETVNVYTDGAGEAFTNTIRSLLRDTTKYKFIDSKIVKLDKALDVEGRTRVVVSLANGLVNNEAFLVNIPYFVINGRFERDLGVEIAPQGHIDVHPPLYETSVPDVFAAGDCATFVRGIPQAIAMGTCAAAGLAHSLQAEDDIAR